MSHGGFTEKIEPGSFARSGGLVSHTSAYDVPVRIDVDYLRELVRRGDIDPVSFG